MTLPSTDDLRKIYVDTAQPLMDAIMAEIRALPYDDVFATRDTLVEGPARAGIAAVRDALLDGLIAEAEAHDLRDIVVLYPDEQGFKAGIAESFNGHMTTAFLRGQKAGAE